MPGFRDIIGQDMLLQHLRSAVRTGKVAHAYILDGEKGMGKKLTASAFVQALQCEEDLKNREGEEPCMVCHSCIRALSGSHPDIITVTHEKPGSIGVDEIRSQVVDDCMIRPYDRPRKIYVIPDAQLMTPQAQNALLKTLEEPPEYVVIILLCENKEMLLPTLISRSVCLSMRAVDNDTVAAYIEEHTDVPAYVRATAVSFSRGNIGKAMMLSESEEFRELEEEVTSLLKGIRKMTDAESYEAASKAGKRKEQKDDYLTFLLLWFRDVLFLKAGGDEEGLIFAAEADSIEQASEYYSFEKLNSIIEAIKDAGSRLDSNVSGEYTYELLFNAMR